MTAGIRRGRAGLASLSGLQERVESSTAGRAMLSVLIAFTLLAVVFYNLPDSELRERQLELTEPFILATGLKQDWALFAPEPRRRDLGLEARIVYPDGTSEIWRPPTADPVVGAYVDFRWRKWYESVIDATGFEQHRNFAEWVARQRRRQHLEPLRVELVARRRQIPPPGEAAGDRVAWETERLYTRELAPLEIE